MMHELIQSKLRQIAHTESLHILLAAESGSRAWGFASPDSDYDVRVVYVRKAAHYLRIDEGKDTFEFIDNQGFDVGGWDIRKSLRLLRKSNAVLLEWLHSPMVYCQDAAFVAALRALLPQYVQAAPLLHHYRGIAHNALRDMDLNGEVRLKKWFYVVRPLLAARWAVVRGGVPPMTLSALLAGEDAAIVAEIADLVALKAGQDEHYRHTLSGSLKRFTQDLTEAVAALNAPVPQPVSTAPLDELFRQTLQRTDD